MEGKGLRQLAVRVDDQVLAAVDAKRMKLASESGVIPTRSDIVRLALEAYLESTDGSAKKKQNK